VNSRTQSQEEAKRIEGMEIRKRTAREKALQAIKVRVGVRVRVRVKAKARVKVRVRVGIRISIDIDMYVNKCMSSI
jgi:hypothetical protein